MSSSKQRGTLGIALLWVCSGLCSPARAEAQRAAEEQAERVARFAVVLGNNQARGVQTLRYADDDALALHQLFLDAGVDSRLLVTLDAATRELHPEASPRGAATAPNLGRELGALRSLIEARAARGEPSEFFFFYSGHGDVEGGEGRIMLEDHAFTRSELYELLEATGADKNHVFLDACSSFFIISKGPDEKRRKPLDPAFMQSQTPDQLDNVGFVLSTSSDRESHEWARYEAGIVSHELRSGLRGAADTDLDGKITYAELAAFMHSANRSIDIPRLRPDPFVSPPGKRAWQAALLRWQPAAASMRVRGGAAGHFYVENARGERLLDAHPAQGQWLRLYLPRDRPLFVRDSDQSAEYELAGLAPLDVTRLVPVAEPLRHAKGAEQLALNQLFAEPFGQSAVHEYMQSLASRPDPLPPRSDGTSRWTRPMGYVALTAAAAGGALSTAALISYLSSADGSQISTQRWNERIARYHRISIVPYAVAAVAAGVWGFLEWRPEGKGSVAVQLSPSLGSRDVYLELGGRF